MTTPQPIRAASRPSTISPPVTAYPESFPYCQRAKEMLAELKRAEWLPPFDEEGVRAVTEECRKLMELLDELSKLGHREPRVAVTMSTFHQSICRNKRCMLAYLNYRLEKIEMLWWKTASPVVAEEFKSKLSKREIEYYARFQESVSRTMTEIDLDLTSHMQPPHDLFIEVRALKDEGEVLLLSGARVFLAKNTIHYLRRSDVEHLIRQNVLEQVI